MKTKLFLFCFLLVMSVGIAAAHEGLTPSVTVSDQVSLDGYVTVSHISAADEAFIVIHKANEEGGIGPVIGQRKVNHGESHNVRVWIDASQATSTLFAMLHNDTNEIGVYEFGSVEGADSPVIVDGAPVSPPFAVELLRVHDQMGGNMVNIANVVTAQNGFVVIHADGGGRPGPVLGVAPVVAGSNSDVAIEISGDVTAVVFPMLHVDTGEAGTYEFGTVEGADGPVVVNGTVATFPIQINQPSMRLHDQIVSDSVVAESVVSAGQGWLVIHQDNNGAPGPVIGMAAVADGLNLNVVVPIDATMLTARVFPMLHVDTGAVGTYEFGSVEGADGPVRVNDAVLTYAINAMPSITYRGTLDGNMLTVAAATSAVQGWLVIHSDNAGSPGPVLGQAPVVVGLNRNITIELSEAATSVFPMLHVDTGEAGVYEFGAVEGADGPVRVNDVVVVGNLTLP